MEETAVTGAVKTDLTYPKPNRRRRLVLQFAALVVAVSALGAAYWFTRPPELVWWRSPVHSDRGIRVRVLTPCGWRFEDLGSSDDGMGMETQYVFTPVDERPAVLRWFLPQKCDNAQLTVFVTNGYKPGGEEVYHDTQLYDYEGTNSARKDVLALSKSGKATVVYFNDNLSAFNRTYRQICNSLRIE
jgi:hypothetical protein